MWLHLLHPEEEARDCDYCRAYRHYSPDNPDPSLRGRPEIGPRGLEKRPPSCPPPCHRCLRSNAWTDDNRGAYEAWVLARSGLAADPPPWAAVLLTEAYDAIQRTHCPLMQ